MAPAVASPAVRKHFCTIDLAPFGTAELIFVQACVNFAMRIAQATLLRLDRGL